MGGGSEALTASGTSGPMRAVCSPECPAAFAEAPNPLGPPHPPTHRALQWRAPHPQQRDQRESGISGLQETAARTGQQCPLVAAAAPAAAWGLCVGPGQTCTSLEPRRLAVQPSVRRPPLASWTLHPAAPGQHLCVSASGGPAPVSWEHPRGAASLAQTGGFREGSLEEAEIIGRL